MLYISTRNKKETYTFHKTIITEKAADGGRFIPIKMPFYEFEQILALQERSFNQVVADVLNAFFASRLTFWDIDLCIGKNPLRLHTMNYRMLLAELWHNPKGDYSYVAEKIYARLSGGETDTAVPDWVRTAVRIAVLFGVYSQLCAQALIKPGQGLDVAVSGDAFEAPMAAFYARQMGLPINVILCAFHEDSAAWELIHRGAFNSSTASDTLCSSIEKLVCATLGDASVADYLECRRNKRSFLLDEEQAKQLSNGFFCAVAGKNRAVSIVNSVYRSSAYVMDPATALCYGSVQDYRSVTGKSNTTLMIAEGSPAGYIDEIAKATGMPTTRILEQIKR